MLLLLVNTLQRYKQFPFESETPKPILFLPTSIPKTKSLTISFSFTSYFSLIVKGLLLTTTALCSWSKILTKAQFLVGFRGFPCLSKTYTIVITFYLCL